LDKEEEQTEVVEPTTELEQAAPPEESKVDSSPKRDIFVHKGNGKRMRFIQAAKTADKARWETEDEFKDRLNDSFDFDEVDYSWEEGKGARSAGKRPSRPNARKRAQLRAETAAESPAEEAESDEVVAEAQAQADEIVAEAESEPTVVGGDDSESTPKESVNAMGKGPRQYNLNDLPGRNKGQSGLSLLREIFTKWPMDAVDAAAKLEEEFSEFQSGTSVKPIINDNIIVLEGDSKQREAVSVVICALKYLTADLGSSVSEVIGLVALAQQEQYDRYHPEDAVASEVQDKDVPFEEPSRFPDGHPDKDKPVEETAAGYDTGDSLIDAA
jgi:hypothetical protein